MNKILVIIIAVAVVAEANDERVASLSALMDAHSARQADPAWPALIESPIFIDKTVDMPYEEGDEYIYWPN